MRSVRTGTAGTLAVVIVVAVRASDDRTASKIGHEARGVPTACGNDDGMITRIGGTEFQPQISACGLSLNDVPNRYRRIAVTLQAHFVFVLRMFDPCPGNLHTRNLLECGPDWHVSRRGDLCTAGVGVVAIGAFHVRRRGRARFLWIVATGVSTRIVTAWLVELSSNVLSDLPIVAVDAIVLVIFENHQSLAPARSMRAMAATTCVFGDGVERPIIRRRCHNGGI